MVTVSLLRVAALLALAACAKTGKMLASFLNVAATVDIPSIALSDLLAGFVATTRQDGETIGCTVQRASCLGLQ